MVSAYNFTAAAPNEPGSNNGNGAAATLPFQTSAASPGDLVYSAVFARNVFDQIAGSLLPGSTPTFTPRAGQGSDHLVQDFVIQAADVAAGNINVTATNTAANAGSWYVFAMRIAHA
jgi:hypothetical protein